MFQNRKLGMINGLYCTENCTAQFQSVSVTSLVESLILLIDFYFRFSICHVNQRGVNRFCRSSVDATC